MTKKEKIKKKRLKKFLKKEKIDISIYASL